MRALVAGLTFVGLAAAAAAQSPPSPPPPPANPDSMAAWGEKMGQWGEKYGQQMGRWGESLGQALGQTFGDTSFQNAVNSDPDSDERPGRQIRPGSGDISSTASRHDPRTADAKQAFQDALHNALQHRHHHYRYGSVPPVPPVPPIPPMPPMSAPPRSRMNRCHAEGYRPHAA